MSLLIEKSKIDESNSKSVTSGVISLFFTLYKIPKIAIKKKIIYLSYSVNFSKYS